MPGAPHFSPATCLVQQSQYLCELIHYKHLYGHREHIAGHPNPNELRPRHLITGTLGDGHIIIGPTVWQKARTCKKVRFRLTPTKKGSIL